MTLILSCITPDFVYQVSDRRLVEIRPSGPPRLLEDEACKAVFMSPVAIFGYTGLAYFHGMRTDGWLLEVLQGKRGMIEALPAVTQGASAAFRSIPVEPRWKRHAFAVVGWDGIAASAHPVPFLVSISNALTPDNRWLDRPEETFSAHITRLQTGETVALHAAGAVLQEAERTALIRNIKRAQEHDERPLAVARLLALSARGVAERDASVGKGLLVGVLPREAVKSGGGYALQPHREGDQLAFSGQLPAETATFLYVPPDSSDQLVTYGPHLSTPDLFIGGVVHREGPAAEEHMQRLQAGEYRGAKPPWKEHPGRGSQ